MKADWNITAADYRALVDQRLKNTVQARYGLPEIRVLIQHKDQLGIRLTCINITFIFLNGSVHIHTQEQIGP